VTDVPLTSFYVTDVPFTIRSIFLYFRKTFMWQKFPLQYVLFSSTMLPPTWK